ncbi:MAG: DUF4153 domain-containing protein [Treponema sp.]
MKTLKKLFVSLLSFVKAYPVMPAASGLVFAAAVWVIFRKPAEYTGFDTAVRILYGAVSAALFCLLSMFVLEQSAVSSRLREKIASPLGVRIAENAFSVLFTAIGFAAGFLCLYFDDHDTYSYMRFWGITFSCAALIAFFQSKKGENRTASLVRNVTLSVMLSLVLFAAFCVVIWAADFLFFKKYTGIEKVYFTAFAFCSSVVFWNVFTTVSFNGGDEYKSTGKVFKLLTVNALFPVYAALLAVLYAYFIKVCVKRTLPDGQINIFVSIASAAFILFYFLLSEYRTNAAVRAFYKVGKFLLFPLFALQYAAFAVRISEYGFTPARYFSFAYIVFSSAFTVLVILKRGTLARYGFLLLAFFIVTATLTPLNALKMSCRNQTHRFSSILEKAGLYDETTGFKESADAKGLLDDDTLRKLRSAYRFLDRQTYEQVPDWINAAAESLWLERESKNLLKKFQYDSSQDWIDVRGYERFIPFDENIYSSRERMIVKAGSYSYDLTDFALSLDAGSRYDRIEFDAADGNKLVFRRLWYDYNLDEKKFNYIGYRGGVLDGHADGKN